MSCIDLLNCVGRSLPQFNIKVKLCWPVAVAVPEVRWETKHLPLPAQHSPTLSITSTLGQSVSGPPGHITSRHTVRKDLRDIPCIIRHITRQADTGTMLSLTGGYSGLARLTSQGWSSPDPRPSLAGSWISSTPSWRISRQIWERSRSLSLTWVPLGVSRCLQSEWRKFQNNLPSTFAFH